METQFLPFPAEREIVVDAGYLAVNRHIVSGLIEVDVTRAREILRELAESEDAKLSFTAFVAACLARAVQANLKVQAFMDWRRRLVLFSDVDVVTMIEPGPGRVAIPHIIREANRKTVRQISDEIRLIQTRPEASAQRGGLTGLGPKLPRFVRMTFFCFLKKNPIWFQRVGGTVVLSSVGMFGKGGGWGISFLPMHNLGLMVGGIAQKPGVYQGEIAIREYLDLTVSFDHDVVDGAPAARFTSDLKELLESASLLEEEISSL